ncbi:MAG: haloacid dehalogenase type II [Chloroflexi bacterium]|nr:haloacid dehalogenase type II [Chloroflexota bacterium]
MEDPTHRPIRWRDEILDFERFEWVSFDCYGTLVDWESGIRGAVDAVLGSHGVRRSRGEILDLFAEIEPRVQSSDAHLTYRCVLRRVMAEMGDALAIRCSEPELDCLADSLADWPVFPEVREVLTALQTRYKLAVISNVDDALFAGTAEALGVEFDAVVTAEQAQSYKPNRRNFDLAAARMRVETDAWLHVAESLFHDIGPANRLGIASVWVNRAGRGGGTRRTDAVPDLVVSDLGELVGLAGLEQG